MKLWLATGVIAPRTTSILENPDASGRELGRRVKKLGWNWSDEGIVRIAKIILLRHYDREAWDRYWREALGLRNRCRIQILWVEDNPLEYPISQLWDKAPFFAGIVS